MDKKVDALLGRVFLYIFLLLYINKIKVVSHDDLFHHFSALGVPEEMINFGIRNIVKAELVEVDKDRVGFMRYKYSYRINSVGTEVIAYFNKRYYTILKDLIEEPNL